MCGGLPKKRGVESEKRKNRSLTPPLYFFEICQMSKPKGNYMRVLHTTTVTHPAGGAAGAAVVISHTKISGDGTTPGLPARGYQVVATPSQSNVTVSITNKTTTGFTITLTPIISSYQIVAGTVDYVVADTGSSLS
jgi:hypothetical protein